MTFKIGMGAGVRCARAVMGVVAFAAAAQAGVIVGGPTFDPATGVGYVADTFAPLYGPFNFGNGDVVVGA
jgi:hypothetical protein